MYRKLRAYSLMSAMLVAVLWIRCDNQEYAASKQSALSPEEESDARRILGVYYPQRDFSLVPVTESVADVMVDMLEATRTCSKALDLVPRPIFIKPGIAYIKRLAKQIIKALTAQNDRIYQICISTTALNYKSILEIAIQDI